MDTCYVLHGITFVWDSNKASVNLRKHGIPFEQAAEAFFDPFLKVVDASRYEEARDAIIGMDTRWNLLFVVHMEMEDEAIRIISARRATRRERAYYEA
ncbi:MAG TPA: BrnT family toxin [Candidatus Tectomicrobia bacterium]